MNTKFKQTEIGEIPNEWNTMSVDEIKSSGNHAIAMGPFGSNITKDNFVDKGVPVIRGNNLNAYKFLDDNFVYVTAQKAQKLQSSTVLKGDIVITHRGTLGQVGVIPQDSKHNKYIVSQSGMKLTCNQKLVLSEFVFYYLKSPIGQKELLKNTSQVGVPSIAQPTSSLKAVLLPVPPLSEQKQIISILSFLYDKIELNRKMSNTLEDMAKALFKHWFVDFEFPDKEGRPYKSNGGEMIESELGPIPMGWENSSLADIAEYLNGLPMQKYPQKTDNYLPVIKIRELKSGVTDTTDKADCNIPAAYVVKNGDILFSWSGSLEVVVWCDGKGALNQHLFKVTSDKYPKWFNYYWLLYHLTDFKDIAANKATTMGHIQRHHLTEKKVLIPMNDVMMQMDQLMDSLFQIVVLNKIQSIELNRLRDSLLPKLMSGKTRVN